MHLILKSISLYLFADALVDLCKLYFFQMEISLTCEINNSASENWLIKYYIV